MDWRVKELLSLSGNFIGRYYTHIQSIPEQQAYSKEYADAVFQDDSDHVGQPVHITGNSEYVGS